MNLLTFYIGANILALGAVIWLILDTKKTHKIHE